MGILISCLGCFGPSCAANCACCLGKYAIGCISSNLKSSVATRLFYTICFVLATILAFIMYNIPAKAGMEYACQGNCLSYLSVLRISFGLVLYHSFLCIFTFAIRNTNDWRSWLHNGLWLLKIIVIVSLLVCSFYIPDSVFFDYHIPALVFSSLFILLQSFLLVDFAWSWAQRWIEAYEDSEEGDNFYRNMLVFFCVLFYSASFATSIWLMVEFGAPKRPDCGLNTYFAVMNLILIIVQSAISVLPQIQELTPKSGLFQSSFLSLYTTYLTASAIITEPSQDGFRCNSFSQSDFADGHSASSPSSNIMAILGLSLTFLALGYSVFSVGSSQLFMERIPVDETGASHVNAGEQNDDEHERTVYDYSYFHFSLFLASFYMAMVITDWSVLEWNLSYSSIKVVHGFGAMWAKIAMSWGCVALYIWTLIAPLIFPDRDFNV